MTTTTARRPAPGAWLGWTAGNKDDARQLADEIKREHGTEFDTELRKHATDGWEVYAR